MAKKMLVLLLVLVVQLVDAGELAQKAGRFDDLIVARHIPRGLVVNLLAEEKDGVKRFRSHGDSTIWTGAYIASQIFRFRVTGEVAAINNVQRCLQAFITLHKMSGSEGFIGRSFGTREEMGSSPDIIPGVGSYSHLVFKADTSRDQYTGILMGCGIAWPFLTDTALKQELGEMVLAVARNLKANNLSLKAVINGFSPSTFDLNPDYAYQDRISPEEWAKVDDFPANVFAAHVAYSDRLASIVSRFRPPPVRGGEALRALMMFQSACNITQDPEICTYFQNDLIERRQLHFIASETSQLLTDVFYGRNRNVVGDRLQKTFIAAARVFLHILAMQAGFSDGVYLWLEPAFMAPVTALAVGFSDMLISGLDHLRSADGFRLLQVPAEELAALAKNLRWVKADKIAVKTENLAQHLRDFSQSNIDEFADTMRSYVGCNLGFFALLGILEQNADPQLRQAALAILPRSFAPIADEGNSLYTFIEAAFCGRPANDPLVEAARKTLRLYPDDARNRRFDHSAGLKHSLWPDRFGRYGRQSVEVIPINQRAPHIFVWQEPPRTLITGSDDGTEIAPVGYLLAYWFGRFHGLLSEKD